MLVIRETYSIMLKKTGHGLAKASKSEKAEPQRQVSLPVATAAVAAAGLAMSPAAHAAMETAQVAVLYGEAGVSQLGWGAIAAVFSFSLSLVVWGRSGM
ncbi:hypothetical protein WJX73_003030 [Symbiochloris irregularis]|uniref:Cytochrome b6-f complex subunit PetN n=1 Tax=Symbiochloris irregularis TaxID=706552 RepID=A0AAW1NR03_9CHLO